MSRTRRDPRRAARPSLLTIRWPRRTGSTLCGALMLVVLLGVLLGALLGAGSRARRWLGRAEPGDSVATATVSSQGFQRRVTADGSLRAVTATEVVVPETPDVLVARKLAWLAPDGSAVKAGDVIVRFDPSDANKQLRDAQISLDAADARLRQEQLRSAATTTVRAAAAIRAREDAEHERQFQAKDPLIYSRKDIAVAEIDAGLAAARQTHAEQAAQSDARVARTSVELRALARRQARLALDHAAAALANMVIRAPTDGILVLRRDDHGDLPKLGVELSAGNPIADIPVPGEMEAELFVLEIDGAGLEVGQPVELVVTSRPELPFHGKIRLVDKLARQRQLSVPVQYLSVIAELDRTDRDVMKPGQRVRATLVQDRRDALVVPRQAVFERLGKSIIYRRRAHGFAPVAVELGPATSGRVVVTSGLAEGDVIALRDPTRTPDLATGSTLGSSGGSAITPTGRPTGSTSTPASPSAEAP